LDLSAASLRKALNSIEFDILHLHWINEQFLDIRELKRISKPIVWTLHDCWPFTGICHYFYDCENYLKKCGKCPALNSTVEVDLAENIWRKKLEVYRDFNIHVVSPSNWLGYAAKNSSLLKDFEVSIIPNCIDSSIYRPIEKQKLREILGLSSKKKYILFGAVNATSDKRKGYQHLQNALPKLFEKLDKNTELLVFGTDDRRTNKISNFPVNYIGYLFDDFSLSAFYNAANVTVVPSLSENLSNVIMESLACGTPIAAFNVGGNSDMIEHKSNGYLAETFDANDLANGINWCLKNNKEQQLSANARRRVEDNYTMELIANKYINLYKSLLN